MVLIYNIEVWKKLKESQKKADEINRISVNKIKEQINII